jgi:hypothetical protein
MAGNEDYVHNYDERAQRKYILATSTTFITERLKDPNDNLHSSWARYGIKYYLCQCFRLMLMEMRFSLSNVDGVSLWGVFVRRCSSTWELVVTSRPVVWLFLKQFRSGFVPVLHRLQGRLAAQG